MLIMKKVIIAVLLLLALVLTGCGGDNTFDTTADTTTASPATTTAAPETTTAVPETTTAAPETTTVAPETTAQPEQPEQPDIKDGLMNIEYVLGSISGAKGTDIGHNGRFKTADYITLEDIEAIAITGDYYITWFAYDKNYTYLGNGSNTYPTLPEAGVWLEAGQDITAAEILAWNADAVYLRFAVKRASGNITLDTDVKASRVKVYVSGYSGDADYAAPGLDKVANITNGRQDGAVYGDYLFSFNSSGACKVYSADEFKLISEFTLDKADAIKPHCNAVCFGSYKYTEGDEFPLLYSNVYNSYKTDRSYDGTCNVYRIVRNGTTFTSTLVQVIKIGFTDDTQRWSSAGGDVRPYGNFVVDTDTNKLYAFTMRDGDKTTRFFSFKLPAVTDGTLDSTLGVNKVVLGVGDIIDSFSTEYFNYVQGATYYNGKIYSLEGFTDDATNKAALRVIDLATKTVCQKIDLYGMNLKPEPEAVYAYNGKVYYFDYTGSVYAVPSN